MLRKVFNRAIRCLLASLLVVMFLPAASFAESEELTPREELANCVAEITPLFDSVIVADPSATQAPSGTMLASDWIEIASALNTASEVLAGGTDEEVAGALLNLQMAWSVAEYVCTTEADEQGTTGAASKNSYVLRPSSTEEQRSIVTESGLSFAGGELLVSFESTASKVKAFIDLLACEQVEATTLAYELSRISFTGNEEICAALTLKSNASVLAASSLYTATKSVAVAQPNYVYYLIDEVEFAVGSDPDEAADEDTSGTSAGGTSTDASTSGTSGSVSYHYPSAAPVAPDSLSVPNDAALHNTSWPYSYAQTWYLEAINAYEAWNYARCEDQVTVAVLDTGCKMTHQELRDRVVSEYAWNVVTNSELTGDVQTHGTHVAGLVAAQTNNTVGIAGVSYNARILPICVFDSDMNCYTSDLLNAYDYVLEYAEELNIHVVNMSLGGYNDLLEDEESRSEAAYEDKLLQDAVTTAKKMNIVTVCAGGNGDANGNPYTIANTPADFPECVSVTALNYDGQTPTSWCDYNNAKDICAPGSRIWSTLPNSNSSYGLKNGTSMAAPIVSGAMALLWAACPSLTVDEACNLIYNTARKLTVPEGRDGLYGAGILDIGAALRTLLDVQPAQSSVEVAENTYAGDFYYVEYSLAEGETGVPAVGGNRMYLQGQDNNSDFCYLLTAEQVNTMASFDIVVYEDETPVHVEMQDVTGNSAITIADALAALDLANAVYSDFSQAPMTAWLAADVNLDGVIDAQDARAILIQAL